MRGLKERRKHNGGEKRNAESRIIRIKRYHQKEGKNIKVFRLSESRLERWEGELTEGEETILGI